MLDAAQAWDDAKYPNWRGEWYRTNPAQWDPTKPPARGQQAPLTPEYKAVYEARLAEQEGIGGQDYNPQVRCLPPGMPRAMIGYEPLEFIVTPDATYIWLVYMHEFRRIYTDGRGWPVRHQPTFLGYSIGKWVDSAGGGKYDLLEVETRGFHGPRLVENTGIPLHEDNQTIIKERMFLGKSNADLINDEITIIDHAFTRPWTVTRTYRRRPHPEAIEYVCHEHNTLVVLGGETYYIREDGYLMPGGKNQPPPDLRYFDQARR
jgi:hypothetical protein